MTRSHAVLVAPLFIALPAIAFCVWTAFGNDVNFCVTAGCTLYQDFSIGGISLWWFGAGAFTFLAACAIMGQPVAGRVSSAIFLIADIALLILMALTAPCVSCLVVAVFFVLCYFFFRRSHADPFRQKHPAASRHSILILIWLAFFVINLGQVARSQLDVWPMLDESGDARLRMFFSPSCKYCVEGINILSGNVDTAFFPVAENDDDVFKIARMVELLDEGMNLAEALGQSHDAVSGGFLASMRPEMLLLRFRLLRNKAHVFSAGSQGVPFFERRGLPVDVADKIMERDRKKDIYPGNAKSSADKAAQSASGLRDYSLPPELDIFGQCGGNTPCPPSFDQTRAR